MDSRIFADFQVIDTPEFNIFYAAYMQAGTVWFDGSVPDWVPLYPGATDPEKDWWYYQPNVFMVNRGSVGVQSAKHSDLVFTKGQGTASNRPKTRSKLTALEDGTSWFCIAPKKQIIYNRAVVVINQGETYTDTLEKDVYYFVSHGKVTVDNKEKTQLSYFKVLANNQVSVLANEDSYIIKVWE